MDLETSAAHAVLCFTELNTAGMTNTIYRDLLCRTRGGTLSTEGLKLRGFQVTKRLYATRLYWLWRPA